MRHVIDLTFGAWVLLAIAAAVVGLSKTALPGGSTVAIVLFATVLPAKSSTAALLLLLIVGDVMALSMYRRHADWRTLLSLAPAVIAGVIVGVLFLAVAQDDWVRKAIGAILLLLIVVTVVRRRVTSAETQRASLWVSGSYGVLGGFTTMVANAGGPVMSMYFIARRFSVQAFLGTAAWFFAIVNLVKVPFMVGLGILTPQLALMDLVLVPIVVAGGFLGRSIARRISQSFFEQTVIVLTVLGALYLLIF